MEINVLKCHGSLNDFVLLDSLKQPEGVWERIDARVVQMLCGRSGPVGADGVLLLDRRDESLPVLRVINADGGEAEISGNGLRCAGRHICDRQRVDQCRVMVHGSPKTVSRTDALAEGVPGFCAQLDGIRVLGEIVLTVPIAGVGQKSTRLIGTLVEAPNPHVMILAADPHSPDPAWLGRCLLPDGREAVRYYNVSYARQLDPTHFHLITFERGVGQTLSCGSAACSLAASCLIEDSLVVYSDGGVLKCRASESKDPGVINVSLTGNATFMWGVRLAVVDNALSVLEGSLQTRVDEIQAYHSFMINLHRKLWADHQIPSPAERKP